MKIKIICFLLLGFFVFSGMKYQPSQVSCGAKSMVVIEQDSKRVLYEKNMNDQLAMASTTKIMTALCVLKNTQDFETELEIDSRAVGIEGTSMYLRKGEKLSTKDLLYGMMLPSGNDAATALALRVSGSIEEFAKLMNEEAKNLNLENSSFKNPHGLDEKDHYTSAYDLAIITAEAMKFPLFNEIIKTKFVTLKGYDDENHRYLKNKNKLLSLFKGCTGVKTGFTDNAGRCFVSSATRNGMSVICVVLNCPNMFEDAAKFMQKAFDEYENYELLPAYNFYRKADVIDGKQEVVKLWTKKGFCYPLTKDEYLKVSYEYELDQPLVAPLEKEQIVGKVKIKLDDKVLFEENIYTIDEIKSNSILENIKDIGKNWNLANIV